MKYLTLLFITGCAPFVSIEEREMELLHCQTDEECAIAFENLERAEASYLRRNPPRMCPDPFIEIWHNQRFMGCDTASNMHRALRMQGF